LARLIFQFILYQIFEEFDVLYDSHARLTTHHPYRVSFTVRDLLKDTSKEAIPISRSLKQAINDS
jgi:hypothetical protein